MAIWLQALLNGTDPIHLYWLTPVAAVLLVFTLTLLSNVLFFPRLKPISGPETPLVSVLLPARNEAGRIGATIAALRQQQYANFELLILDDNSDDGTGAIIATALAEEPRGRMLLGQPLPAGWLGKNWACFQLAQAARGDYLVFIDADVALAPEALNGIISQAEASGADMLSVWPTQQVVSGSERALVPLINLVIFCYIPALAIHHTPWPLFAAANGQCLAFHRDAYWALQGHQAVKDDVLEDIALARAVKAAGRRLRLARGHQLVACRMYEDWSSIRDGFAKNILAGYGNSPPALLAATLFHWFIFVWPWLAIFMGGGILALVLAIWGILLRGGTALLGRTPLLDALSLPFTVPLMSLIAWRSFRWWQTGQTQWKGRLLNTHSAPHSPAKSPADAREADKI